MTDDDLFARAMKIWDRKANGCWLPIIHRLAARHHLEAMTFLAAWYDDHGVPAVNTDRFSSTNLRRRAWRMDNGNAAQNEAMQCFNSNDMAGFRRWARRAAELGETDCADHIRFFELRLPHTNARKVGRLRPERRRDVKRWAAIRA